jgi:hypothetical protein
LKSRYQVGLAAALFLIIPTLASAQRAGRITAAPTVARSRTVSANPVVAHPSTHRPTGSRAAAGASTLNADDSSSLQQLLDPFPTNGFNFEHLSALNQDLALKALIDPATQARLALAHRLHRNNRFTAGYFLLDGGGSYAVPVDADQQPQAQQPVIIIQQAAPEQVAEQPAAEYAPEQAAAPVPDEGEFTLVLRNGKQLQAAAFTRRSDKIVYITPDGGRRTLAVGDLDTDATQRVNQERGVPLQLSL